MRYRFSRRAEADLEEITASIARGDPERAVAFLNALREHCRGLPGSLKTSPLRPHPGDEGVRLSVFGAYVVLYVTQPQVIEIRRLLHGARDLAEIE